MKDFRKKAQKIEKQALMKASKKIRKMDRRTTRPNRKVTVIGKALRGVGRLAGNYFGAGGVGEGIGAGISRIFGQGDYRMPQKNSLMVGGVPSFSPLTSGFRIRHREYVQDINSSTTFASQSFSLNPGISTLFPWLSTVAQNFEEYRIHGMVVYLNTLSATAVSSTNTALGLWGAVTQYDPTEPDFTTKQQCENYVGCQTAVPSCSLIHGIECKSQVNVLDRFYVRSGTIADSEDLKFYDLGKIQIFTQGSQAVSDIGEMWVSYDIEFMKPRLPTNQNNFVATDRFYNASGVTSAQPLGSNTLPTAGSTLGSTINASGTVITLPANAPNTNYVLIVRWAHNAVTSANYTLTLGGSLVAKNYWANNAQANYGAPGDGMLANIRLVDGITFAKTNGTTGTITLSGGTVGGSATVDIVITQMSTGFAALEKGKVNRLGLDEIEFVRQMIKRSLSKKSPAYRPIEYEEDERFRQDQSRMSKEDIEMIDVGKFDDDEYIRDYSRSTESGKPGKGGLRVETRPTSKPKRE